MFQLGVINSIFWCVALACVPFLLALATKAKKPLLVVINTIIAVIVLFNLSLAVNEKWLSHFFDSSAQDWTKPHDYIFYTLVALDVVSAFALLFVKKPKLNKKLWTCFVVVVILATITCNVYNFYTCAVNYKYLTALTNNVPDLLKNISSIALYARLALTLLLSTLLVFLKPDQQEEQLQHIPQEEPSSPPELVLITEVEAKPATEDAFQQEESPIATDTATDEIVAETVEEEPIAETVEEATEETVQEQPAPTEEPVEEVVEEQTEETIQEIEEEPVEEVAEEQTEETIQEVEEEAIEEEIVAETVEEEPIAETVEEATEETIQEIEEEAIEEEIVAETVEEEPIAETVEEATEETIQEIEEEPVEEEIVAETVEEEPIAETIEEATEEVMTDESFDQTLSLVEELSIEQLKEDEQQSIPQESTEEEKKPVKKLSKSKKRVRPTRKFVNYIRHFKAETQMPNMYCKNCGTRTHSESKVCPRCFHKMVPLYKCPQCGTLNETRECKDCGTKIGRR